MASDHDKQPCECGHGGAIHRATRLRPQEVPHAGAEFPTAMAAITGQRKHEGHTHYERVASVTHPIKPNVPEIPGQVQFKSLNSR
jgi:hypothetical protein